MLKRLVKYIKDCYRGYTDKELLYKCANIYKEYAELVENDIQQHWTGNTLKRRATKMVCGDKLYNKLEEYSRCPACYIVKNKCKDCLLLSVWGRRAEHSEGMPCCYQYSPFNIAISLEYTNKERKAAALKIYKETKKIADSM